MPVTAGEMRRALIDWAAADEAAEEAWQNAPSSLIAGRERAVTDARTAALTLGHALLSADRARIATLSAEVRALSTELNASLADEAGE